MGAENIRNDLRIISLLCLLSLLQCNAQVLRPGRCPTVVPVATLDIPKYVGVWYEQMHSRRWTGLELKCSLEYFESKQPDLFEVNSFTYSHLANKTFHVRGAASSKIKQGPQGILSIKIPDFGIDGEVWILGTDYNSYTVMWSCMNADRLHFENVVVMTRQPQPDSNVLTQAMAVLAKNKIQHTYMQHTSHSDCPNIDPVVLSKARHSHKKHEKAAAAKADVSIKPKEVSTSRNEGPTSVHTSHATPKPAAGAVTQQPSSKAPTAPTPTGHDPKTKEKSKENAKSAASGDKPSQENVPVNTRDAAITMHNSSSVKENSTAKDPKIATTDVETSVAMKKEAPPLLSVEPNNSKENEHKVETPMLRRMHSGSPNWPADNSKDHTAAVDVALPDHEHKVDISVHDGGVTSAPETRRQVNGPKEIPKLETTTTGSPSAPTTEKSKTDDSKSAIHKHVSPSSLGENEHGPKPDSTSIPKFNLPSTAAEKVEAAETFDGPSAFTLTTTMSRRGSMADDTGKEIGTMISIVPPVTAMNAP